MFQDKSRGMGAAIIFVSILFLVLLGVLIYGIFTIDFTTDLRTFLTMPLWIVTTDLSVGVFLFLGWVLYREKTIIPALVIFVLSIALGNLVSCLYVLLILLRTSTWQEFWLGRSA